MSNKTYISFVVQSAENHTHQFEIVDLPEPGIAKYSDNTSQEVVKWAVNKQVQLKPNEKLVIINYFNVSNLE
jgi:hypothetical protein